MSNNPSAFRTGFMINMKLLYATFILFLGWVFWPEECCWWYGFYLVSVVFYLAGGALIINAIKQMIERYKRNKAIDDALAQGEAPKTSQVFTSDEALREAGLNE